MTGRAASNRWAAEGRSPDTVDRLLVGLCALIWLILLGMSVAAVVALVDLGRGFHKPTQSSHTGLLYIVIGVSALIILAAIPVLLRARQTTPVRRPDRPPPGFPPERGSAPSHRTAPGAPRAGFDGRAGGRRHTAAPAVEPDSDQVDRVLLRGMTELASAIGVALTAVAGATYLMAIGKDGAAWAGYGVAGLITAVMPVVPWWYLRQLRDVLATHRPPR
ncbi:MAG TPA: DUF2561 family protein [Mycobacterium sp.]|nr:DUF2561 family protein [Mycobacterium sp.]